MKLRLDLIPLVQISSGDFEEARDAFLNWAARRSDETIVGKRGEVLGQLGEVLNEVSTNTVFGRDFIVCLLAECFRTDAPIAQVLANFDFLGPSA